MQGVISGKDESHAWEASECQADRRSWRQPREPQATTEVKTACPAESLPPGTRQYQAHRVRKKRRRWATAPRSTHRDQIRLNDQIRLYIELGADRQPLPWRSRPKLIDPIICGDDSKTPQPEHDRLPNRTPNARHKPANARTQARHARRRRSRCFQDATTGLIPSLSASNNIRYRTKQEREVKKDRPAKAEAADALNRPSACPGPKLFQTAECAKSSASHDLIHDRVLQSDQLGGRNRRQQQIRQNTANRAGRGDSQDS